MQTKNIFLFHNMCIKTNYFSYPGKDFKRYTCTYMHDDYSDYTYVITYM